MTQIEIYIPELDKIKTPNWLTTIDYSPLQQVEIDELIDKHVWVTANRRQIPVNQMSTTHIQNCIKCWNGTGRVKIPNHYLGGKGKWLGIFNGELQRRN